MVHIVHVDRAASQWFGDLQAAGNVYDPWEDLVGVHPHGDLLDHLAGEGASDSINRAWK
jgi:hypothetical protein